MQLLANYLTLAALYALIACGYVLVYRVSRVLTLAHGEVMMVGAYLLLTMGTHFHLPPLPAFIAALLMSLVVGLAIYWMVMRRMAGETVFAAVLVTIALGILLRGAMALVWTPRLQYPAEAIAMENPSVALGGSVAVSQASLLIIASAVLVYGGLFLFFRHTTWGVRMRAVGENPRLAAQRGIAPHGPLALAWGIAALTGGLAGMLLSIDTGIDEAMAIIGLKTFPVVLVGGLDSLSGAIIGALVVAGAEILAIYYVDPLVADVAPFLVLLAILMVRPWGLFGTREELDRV